MASSTANANKLKRAGGSRPVLRTRGALRKQSHSSEAAPAVTARSKDKAASAAESEDEEDDEPAFKRVKLNEPLYISQDMALPTPTPIYNSHEDEDYEDLEEEEMPKFQYKSKYVPSKAKSPTASQLYTPAEREVVNDVLFRQYVDLDDHDAAQTGGSDNWLMKSFEQEEQLLGFVSDSDDLQTGDSLPLVTPPELSNEASVMVRMPAQRQQACDPLARWPIGLQDNSTSFSTLGKLSSRRQQQQQGQKGTKPAAMPEHAVAESLFEAPSEEESSMDDFFMYDSMTSVSDDTDESDGKLDPSASPDQIASTCAGSSSSLLAAATTSTAGAAAATHTLPFTARNIPICGYRDRNRALVHVPAGGRPLNAKRIMAALASVAPRDGPSEPASGESAQAQAGQYYQQALVAAAGLNNRSLFSGKAAEMFAAGDYWA